LLEEGELRPAEIARMYGVSRQAVSQRRATLGLTGKETQSDRVRRHADLLEIWSDPLVAEHLGVSKGVVTQVRRQLDLPCWRKRWDWDAIKASLRARRLDANLTLDNVAGKLKVDRQQMWRYERGRFAVPQRVYERWEVALLELGA